MSLRFLTGLLVSAVLLYVFFGSVDAAEIVDAIAAVDLRPLLPAVLVYFFGVWLRAARWRRLLAAFTDVPTSRLFRVIIIGFAVNNVLPLRLGEVVRAFLLRHSSSIPLATTLGCIMLERCLDVAVLCGLMAFVSLFIPLDGWLAGLASFAWMVTAAAFIALVLLFAAPRSFLRWVMSVAVRAGGRLSQRLGRLVESFLSGIRAIETPRALLSVGYLSVACWVAELGLYYWVMVAFGFDSGIPSLVLGMVAANLATVLPSSPGYVGTFDVPLRAALSETSGVAAATASSYTVLTHALLLVPVVVLGAVLLSREDLSIRALSHGKVRLRSEQPTSAAS